MPVARCDMHNKITNAISSILNVHAHTPYVFLTEDDVRCRLYSVLFNEFSDLRPTRDTIPQQSISLHSEVRWYGNNGKLKYRSDIVVLDVATLRVKELAGLQLPSKGYGFNIFHAIVEIKLRRANGGSDKQFARGIENDLGKLNRIKEAVDPYNNESAKFYMLCLDNKGDISDQVDGLRNANGGFAISYSRLTTQPNNKEAAPTQRNCISTVAKL